jgi:hypothetical protein
MEKRLSIGALIIFILVSNVGTGICWWPFGKENESKLDKIISEYKDFEEDQNYTESMLRKIESAVRGDGKKSLTMRMAYMRLKYYKAVENQDQKTISEVSNEAESLLKGDHPLFRQAVRKADVRNFLHSLKEARYNEERSYSWPVFLITVLAGTILFFIIGLRSGDAAGLLAMPVIGAIIGGLLYHFLLIGMFYTKTIVYLDIPSVPLIA